MRIVGFTVGLRRAFSWVDLAILAALTALIYGLVGVAGEWKGVLRPTVAIDLSPWALPEYAFYSAVRGFAAYILSFLFTLAYGYLAASNRTAERILLPLLDILQSIPVLGFLPGLVLALVAFFPDTNMGLELAAVIMIFTGQVWNMTFSFYRSLRTIPQELQEASRVYGLSWWQRFTRLEMPFAANNLLWNSMMSMAGGWFFLMINEAFVLGEHDFRLPGLGSYMSVAVMQDNIPAMVYAVIAMVVMIVAIDFLVWRPAIAWAQKFKVGETAAAERPRSAFLELARKSRLFPLLRKRLVQRVRRAFARRAASPSPPHHRAAAPGRENAGPRRWPRLAGAAVLAASCVLIAVGVSRFLHLLASVPPAEWLALLRDLGLTLLRVAAAVVLGTAIMLPLGVVIGLRPRLSRMLQPVVQIAASFPAPMVFPAALLLLSLGGVGIEEGAVALMLLGTQWYILFNVIAGAMAIPVELREAAGVLRLSGWQRWKTLVLPGVFPGLVTGWVTAAGGAWNASIVAEYVHYGHKILIATGLGAAITVATDEGKYASLAAGVFLMAVTVILINRLFWRRLFAIAERKYTLTS